MKIDVTVESIGEREKYETQSQRTAESARNQIGGRWKWCERIEIVMLFFAGSDKDIFVKHDLNSFRWVLFFLFYFLGKI